MNSTTTVLSFIASTWLPSWVSVRNEHGQADDFWWSFAGQGIRARTVRWAVDGISLQLFCGFYLQMVPDSLQFSGFITCSPCKCWITADTLGVHDFLFFLHTVRNNKHIPSSHITSLFQIHTPWFESLVPLFQLRAWTILFWDAFHGYLISFLVWLVY